MHSLGINTYAGAIPPGITGFQGGIFLRSRPWLGSFFLTSRLGYMETQWGHPEKYQASGMSLGFDIGNRWYYENGFTQGVTWLGSDFYLFRKSKPILPHGLRYEIGWIF